MEKEKKNDVLPDEHRRSPSLQTSPPSLQYIGFYNDVVLATEPLTAGTPPGKQLAVATQSEARGSNLNLAPGFSLDF